MGHEDLAAQLKRLVTGLADSEIKAGRPFMYDGGHLHADEVADLMLPSMLCIAQDVAVRHGMNSFGMRFMLGVQEPASFPLAMDLAKARGGFMDVAPFVQEVFLNEVLDCRNDLARLFESAAKVVQPDFDLGRDSNYHDLSN